MNFPCDYNIGDASCYRRYCEKYPDTSVTYKQYREMVRNYFNLFSKYLVTTGAKVSAFPKSGNFQMFKKKVKMKRINVNGTEILTMKIDWKKTKEKKKYIFHLNSHTSGYYCTVMWSYEKNYIKKSWFIRRGYHFRNNVTKFIRENPDRLDNYPFFRI